MASTGNMKVTTLSDREIVLIRVFDAPRHLVFEAHTKPELLKRWLHGPDGWLLMVCEIDLKVGGKYRYVWRHTDGREMGMGGFYREIVPPERLVTTELFDEDWTGGETLGTLILSEQNGKTTLTNTLLYPSKEARDGMLKSGMEHGVSASYDRLEGVLASIA
jgi:uncharacterized protein YndB with AHSA1/START domain